MQRHIVVSDIHGNPALLTNALEHCNFRPGIDKLIVAGDWSDVGGDTALAWHLIKENADTILLGNHELAHIDHIRITPYDKELDLTELPIEWREMLRRGQIKLAHNIGDVLITHAGLSWEMAELLNLEEVTAEKVAELLNDVDSLKIWGCMDIGPMWFRPLLSEFGDTDLTHIPYGTNLRQIAGHTPLHYYNAAQRAILDGLNFVMIDPYARENFGEAGYCVYAEVTELDNGEIKITRVTNRD